MATPPAADDVHETLHAVRLVADLLERAMGEEAALRVLALPEVAKAHERAAAALEALYQTLGREMP
jgi:hypothetical protein